MSLRLVEKWALASILLLITLQAHAFLRIRSPLYGIVAWNKTQTFNYTIYDGTRFKTISHTTFAHVLQEQYARWSDLAYGTVDFSFLGLSSEEISYIKNRSTGLEEVDSIHTHRVVPSGWNELLALSASAIAVTLVYTDKNKIIDADIVYNEETYNFCTDIASCLGGEMHLPSIVLHELGHQLGFDHASLEPSIMAATIQYATARDIKTTDQNGAICTYAKEVTSPQEYATACAKAEGEGALGASDIYLSASPTPITGCGSTGGPPTIGGSSHAQSILIYFLCLFILILRTSKINLLTPNPIHPSPKKPANG